MAEAIVGKKYPAFEYEVGREKIREYVTRSASPTRCTTIPTRRARQAFAASWHRPCSAWSTRRARWGRRFWTRETGINLMMMVHGSQEFEWSEPVVAGDTITTEVVVKDVFDKNGMKFYVWESESRNQDGRPTVKGTWTNIVRGG